MRMCIICWDSVTEKLDKLEEAFKYYNKALKLNPRHLGANEYIGERLFAYKKSQKSRRAFGSAG